MKSKKIVISRDVVVDEVRLFGSRKLTMTGLEINFQDEGNRFSSQFLHPEATGNVSAEEEINYPLLGNRFPRENAENWNSAGSG